MPRKSIEDRRRYDRERYAHKVRNGKCVTCVKKAQYPFVMCEKHRLEDTVKSKKKMKLYSDKLREIGRCMRCSAKMLPDEGNYKTCMNCRLGIKKPKRSKYATIIVPSTI